MSVGRRRGVDDCRGGCAVKILVLFVVMSAVSALAWMLFLPAFVVGQIHERTGFDATVASLSGNPFTGRFVMRGLVLGNPATFPPGNLGELREMSVEFDLSSLWGDQLVFDRITLDVGRILLVQRADGKSNAQVWATAWTGTTRDPNWLIRRLRVRVDLLAMADTAGGSAPLRERSLGIDQSYENVSAGQQLLVPDVLRRVKAANFEMALARWVPGEFGRKLGEAAREPALLRDGVPDEAGKDGPVLFKGLRERLEESKKP
jgi:hypothetical protein